MHGDLNTPDSVPDGALDWMGVAHMLGETDATPELRDFGPRTPLLDDDQIVLLAHAAIRARRASSRRSSAAGSPGVRVRRSPPIRRRPRAKRSRRSAACDRLAVHFDVDCIDFTDAPLSENTGRNIGLTQDDAFAALAAVLRDPRVGALTITELNPTTARRTARRSRLSSTAWSPRSPARRRCAAQS